MNCQRIKLLITLGLFVVTVAAVWPSSQADARGLHARGGSSQLSATRPSVAPLTGDPDIGQGGIAAPPPSLKHLHGVGDGNQKSESLNEWVLWAGRIWATLYLRAWR